MKPVLDVTTTLITLLGASTAIAYEVKLPQIRAGMKYKQAREIVSRSGWYPVSVPWQEQESKWSPGKGSREYAILEKGYSDIQVCAGTGLGNCIFLWQDGSGNQLELITSGQADKEPEDLPVTAWRTIEADKVERANP